MNTTSDTSSPDFRTRLIAFVVVLAVGFAMGWFNGSEASREGAQRDAADQQAIESTEDAEQQAPLTSPTQEQSSRKDQGDNAQVTPEAQQDSSDTGQQSVAPTRGPTVEEDGWYTTKEEVALYIHTYGHLPGNFISKTKARAKGWEASEGNLDEVCPGMSIGGSRYYDYDEDLPYRRGRTWTECDIDYHGGYRGAERIVFSNDGLIFYTADHYETFEQLY